MNGRRIYLWIGLAAASILALAVFGRFAERPFQPHGVQGVGDLYIVPDRNFSVEIDSAWKSVPVDAITLPTGFSSPKFAFQKTGTPCVFADIESVDTPDRDVYTQTTPGERVYVGKSQIDSWWWAPRKEVPKGFEPAFTGREPFPGEVRVAFAGYVVSTPHIAPTQFILFMRDGSAVSSDCDTQVTSMLASFKEWFEPAHITSASDGYLAVLNASVSNRSVLAFKSFGTNEYKEVVEMPDSSSHYVVHDDLLYFLSGGSLLTFNPYTSAVLSVQGIATSTGHVVTDFYLKGDRLWYLSGGEDCAAYHTICDIDVYEISAQGGYATLLAAIPGVMSGAIVGFDASARALYLRGGFGDAGCYLMRMYEYSYDTATTSMILEDEGCADDSPSAHASTNIRIQSILAGIGTLPPSAPSILLSDGHLSLPEQQEDQTGAVFVFVP